MVDQMGEKLVGSVLSFDGEIIATGVTEEEYMEKYAEHFCELVDGKVIKLAPINSDHDEITRFLSTWLATFLELRPIAAMRRAPFVMKLPLTGSLREPDLQVILHEHTDRQTEICAIGAADLVVEVVSPESSARDYGDKFVEYETGGVPEYWLIDPLRREPHFYVLNSEGRYNSRPLNAEGEYESVVLQGLKLPVELLWLDSLPGPLAIAQQMLALLA